MQTWYLIFEGKDVRKWRLMNVPDAQCRMISIFFIVTDTASFLISLPKFCCFPPWCKCWCGYINRIMLWHVVFSKSLWEQKINSMATHMSCSSNQPPNIFCAISQNSIQYLIFRLKDIHQFSNPLICIHGIEGHI